MSFLISSERSPGWGQIIVAYSTASSLPNKDAIIADVIEHAIHNKLIHDSEVAWLQLCMEEVVVNAMVHGNESDLRMTVEVSLWTNGRRWVVQVDDQGFGFGKDQVPNPEGEDALTREHGRGILLMTDWLDALEYYRSGATACLIRRHSALIDPDVESS